MILLLFILYKKYVHYVWKNRIWTALEESHSVTKWIGRLFSIVRRLNVARNVCKPCAFKNAWSRVAKSVAIIDLICFVVTWGVPDPCLAMAEAIVRSRRRKYILLYSFIIFSRFFIVFYCILSHIFYNKISVYRKKRTNVDVVGAGIHRFDTIGVAGGTAGFDNIRTIVDITGTDRVSANADIVSAT